MHLVLYDAGTGPGGWCEYTFRYRLYRSPNTTEYHGTKSADSNYSEAHAEISADLATLTFWTHAILACGFETHAAGTPRGIVKKSPTTYSYPPWKDPQPQGVFIAQLTF